MGMNAHTKAFDRANTRMAGCMEGPASEAMPTGRVCRKCPTILSIYNTRSHCTRCSKLNETLFAEGGNRMSGLRGKGKIRKEQQA